MNVASIVRHLRRALGRALLARKRKCVCVSPPEPMFEVSAHLAPHALLVSLAACTATPPRWSAMAFAGEPLDLYKAADAARCQEASLVCGVAGRRRCEAGSLTGQLSRHTTFDDGDDMSPGASEATLSEDHELDISGYAGSGPCTAMVRNLAYKSTQESFMRALDELGFAGKYDAVYIPGNPARKTNLGYGFVNFASLEDLKSFHRLCHNRPLDSAPASKPCCITVSTIQGIRGLRSTKVKREKANTMPTRAPCPPGGGGLAGEQQGATWGAAWVLSGGAPADDEDERSRRSKPGRTASRPAPSSEETSEARLVG